MYSPIPAKVPVKTTFLLDFVNFFFHHVSPLFYYFK